MDLKRALAEDPANKDVRQLYQQYKAQARLHATGTSFTISEEAHQCRPFLSAALCAVLCCILFLRPSPSRRFQNFVTISCSPG